MIRSTIYCAATRQHSHSCLSIAELQTSEDEIVFSYNCNTPNLDGLVDRDYMCTLPHHMLFRSPLDQLADIPQVVRVNATLFRQDV